MSITTLLTTLSFLDVGLSAHGSKLEVVAAEGVLTPDLLKTIQFHKPGILRRLRCERPHWEYRYPYCEMVDGVPRIPKPVEVPT